MSAAAGMVSAVGTMPDGGWIDFRQLNVFKRDTAVTVGQL